MKEKIVFEISKRNQKKENNAFWTKNIIKFGGLFIIPIIIIHILFKIKLGIHFFEATWESGDVLNYTASFYVLICTVIIAKNQNNLLISQNKIQEEQVRIAKRQDKIEWYSRAIDIKLVSIIGNFDKFQVVLECDKKDEIQNINFSKIRFMALNAGNYLFDEKVCLTFLNSQETDYGWNIDVWFNIHGGNKFEDSDIFLIYEYINRYNDTYQMEMRIKYDWVNKKIKKKEVKYRNTES